MPSCLNPVPIRQLADAACLREPWKGWHPTPPRAIPKARPPRAPRPAADRNPSWDLDRSIGLGHVMWITSGMVWCRRCGGHKGVGGSALLNGLCSGLGITRKTRESREYVLRRLLDGLHHGTKNRLGTPMAIPRVSGGDRRAQGPRFSKSIWAFNWLALRLPYR